MSAQKYENYLYLLYFAHKNDTIPMYLCRSHHFRQQKGLDNSSEESKVQNIWKYLRQGSLSKIINGRHEFLRHKDRHRAAERSLIGRKDLMEE